MSVDVKAEVVIERPREVVADLMFNPKCDMIWVGGLTNVFPLTSGLLKKDSKVERVGSFAGRAFSTQLLVIKDVPNTSIEMSGDEPFEMKLFYELSDVPEGTRAKIRVQSIGEIRFQMPPTVLAKKVQENITADLKKLKKHLETESV